ncbi:uncharacterized protein LOC108678180 [Hyalella azteca]|uniref:Uncharacterized protein LOC108678180 n=1 Tax=Hyalella azteca TaxID=294128 RepID=A0A8B7P791_HYAAZ|nr:uncharacterized protein LOC108678180 [Hyalella azteca]
MLLPSVTLSELGSEPRTPLSITPTSAMSQHSYWSVGRGSQQPFSLDHDRSDPFRAMVFPPPYDLPPKYATMYSVASPTHREHMASFTSTCRRSNSRSMDPEGSMGPDSFTCRSQTSVNGQAPKPGRARTRQLPSRPRDSNIDSDSSLSSIKAASSSTSRDPCVVEGRRLLVSSLGYSSPKVLNPALDELDVNVNKTKHAICRRKSVHEKTVPSQANKYGRESAKWDNQSPILASRAKVSRYGADQNTNMTLSTGFKIEQMPLLTSTNGSSRSRSRSRSSSHSRRVKEQMVSSAPESDLIQNLGIATGLSAEPRKTISMVTTGKEENRPTSKPLGAEGLIKESESSTLPPEMEVSEKKVQEPNVGSLGAVEVELKYQAVQQQLVVTVISALSLPVRFHNPETKLYVKVLIGTSTRYTTPAVPGTESPNFSCTLAHRVPSAWLSRTPLRLSVCQIDGQNRRVVVGYATVNLAELWPILHLNTRISHNLTTHRLILPLSDSTPQHQLACDGNITFGLKRDCSKVTVSSVTLQDVRSSANLDIGNCLVYLKASVYQGKEIICWRRSQPVLLNRQRTHLTHELELKIDPKLGDVAAHSSSEPSADLSGASQGAAEASTSTSDKNLDSPTQQHSENEPREYQSGTGVETSDDIQDRLKEQCDQASLSEFMEGIMSEKLKSLSEALEGKTLQCQQEQADQESSSTQMLLVLSVRLKTVKRGGRCILGTIQLGDAAPTSQGRSHWQRAAACTEVPAAGTHQLTHSSG